MTARTTSRRRRLFFLPLAAAVGGVLTGTVAGGAAAMVVRATARPDDTPPVLDGFILGMTTGIALGVVTWLVGVAWFANAAFPRGRRAGALRLALGAAVVVTAAVLVLAAVVAGSPFHPWALPPAAVLAPAAAGAAFVQWDRQAASAA